MQHSFFHYKYLKLVLFREIAAGVKQQSGSTVSPRHTKADRVDAEGRPLLFVIGRPRD
jgi:hypothetical protein